MKAVIRNADAKETRVSASWIFPFLEHYRVRRGRIYIRVCINTPECTLRCRLLRATRVSGRLLLRADERARGRARSYKLLRDGEQILLKTGERKRGRGGGLIRSFK